MRVSVKGDCPSARALRGDLTLAGFHVTDSFPRFTVMLEEFDGVRDEIVVDSIECPMDRAIVKNLRELANVDLRIHTKGGVQEDDQIRVTVVANEETRKAVETAILRGILQISRPTPLTDEDRSRNKSAAITVIILVLLLLFAKLVHGQTVVSLTNDAFGNPISSTGTSLNVNCTGGTCAGSGGGGTFSAFGAAFPANGTAAGFKDNNGNMAAGLLDASGNLLVKLNATVNVPVTQATSPWVDSITTWAGGTLGAMANYGTSPGAVLVPGVNANVTNTVNVTGTVTANAGTNLNTSALALDTSVNGLLLGQGSTTSGQKGPLIQGAVTTSAPGYTNAQTSPFSLTTGGALRVDASATTQPVSGTVTVNQGTNPWIDSVTGTVTANQGGAPWSVSETYSNVPQGEMIAPLPIYGPNSAGVPPQNTVEIAAFYSPNPPVIQKGQATRLQADGNGNLLARITQPLPPSPTYIQDAVGLRPSWGPCLTFARQKFVINTSSNTLIATGSPGKNFYICEYAVLPCAAACNVALVEGTGATCGTGTAGLQGGATAATGANVAQNGGFIIPPTFNGDDWGSTATLGDSICLYPSAAVEGYLRYVGPL